MDTRTDTRTDITVDRVYSSSWTRLIIIMSVAVYPGLLLTILLFGPPIGFALGGVLSRVPVDLSGEKLKGFFRNLT